MTSNSKTTEIAVYVTVGFCAASFGTAIAIGAPTIWIAPMAVWMGVVTVGLVTQCVKEIKEEN